MINFEIYIITLDKKSQRYKHSINQLKEHFPEYLINTHVSELFDYFRLNEGRNKYRNLAENSCTFAHTKVIEQSLNNDKHCLIVEDDILINDAFNYFPKYMRYLDENEGWDLFYFYNTFCFKEEFNVIFNEGTKAAHFYLVNRKSKYKILNYLHENNIIIDNLFRKLNRKKKINLWSTGQQLVSQYISNYGSNITLNYNSEKIKKKSNGVFV